jgi:aryl-alcohol dehydrogenase-like predicted oxidoreductase
MQTTPFGKTGFAVSRLGFGTAPAAFLKTEQATAAKMIESLLDRGLNLLDTALMYPGSEEFIGNHLAHRRRDYFLVSKCGQKVPGSDAKEWTPEAIAAAVDRSLKLTKAGHLDVMLLHSCDLKTLQQGDAVQALVHAREAGKIRFVGYSGDNEAAAHAATLPDVAVIETSVNLVDQANIDMLFPLARQHRVGIIAKRPIANAAWKDLEQQPGFYKNYARSYTERFAKLGLSPADLGFSDGPAAWPEIALRFTLSFPEVSTAIVGTTNPANAERNLALAAKGPLPADAVQTIRAAFARARGSESWPGLT